MRARRKPLPPPVADPLKACVPEGHPLVLWSLEEAAKHCAGLHTETLRESMCPRIAFGARILFDPIETIAWFRLHLTHVVSTDARRVLLMSAADQANAA